MQIANHHLNNLHMGVDKGDIIEMKVMTLQYREISLIRDNMGQLKRSTAATAAKN